MIDVPLLVDIFSILLSPLKKLILEPISSSSVLLIKLTLLMALMLAKASPLKPIVCILYKSSTFSILLVECLIKARLTSSLFIPLPLSETDIFLLPPSYILIMIFVAPASIEFSTSSLTTETGLSITSPAAIFSTVSFDSTFII